MSDIGVVINLIKEKHCYDCDCLDVGDCYGCDVYKIIEEIGDAFTEATEERRKYETSTIQDNQMALGDIQVQASEYCY